MRWLCWWRPPCLLQPVIVNLISDPTTAIKAVLWSTRGPWLTFRDAYALKANSSPTKMDGDIVVHRRNVAFLQVLR